MYEAEREFARNFQKKNQKGRMSWSKCLAEASVTTFEHICTRLSSISIALGYRQQRWSY